MYKFETAKDIATSELYYIDGLSSIEEAINMMKNNNANVLIIKKRDEHDANGIISVSDIIRGCIIPDKNPKQVSVYELMTKPVISVPATLNAKYVPKYMLNCKINMAPVEENGVYVGLVRFRDIVCNFI